MKQHLSVHIIISNERDSSSILVCKKSRDGHIELLNHEVSFGDDPDDVAVRILPKGVAGNQSKPKLAVVTSYLNSPGEQRIILVYTLTIDESSLVLEKGLEWFKLSEIHRSKLPKDTYMALEAFGVAGPTGVNAGPNVEEVVDDSTIGNSGSVIIYSDGGSRGNPGPSASGFVILNPEGELLFEGGKYLGITTNNQAEYQAVRMGLERALELGARQVDFRMDSLLIVNQMAGVYKIRNRDLWPIYAHIKELIKRFDNVKFTHVRREFNKEADAMVNKILDEHK